QVLRTGGETGKEGKATGQIENKEGCLKQPSPHKSGSGRFFFAQCDIDELSFLPKLYPTYVKYIS
ncbi:MAG: hypothetical protein J1F16_10295, partial [Muribaculaceae bacterium]|nr:hypothetical protein [Muribaculaceae bacterium]